MSETIGGNTTNELQRGKIELPPVVIERHYARPIAANPPTALQHQEGGDHYKDLAIQPVEYIHKNRLGFIEGCVVKYVTRWRVKGGVEDLKKARHFLDMLIEMEDAP